MVRVPRCVFLANGSAFGSAFCLKLAKGCLAPLHALVVRGGWLPGGEWRSAPYLDLDAAEKLFRHKVLSFSKREGLISKERIEMLLSWRHNGGFSVENSVKVTSRDASG